MAKVLKFPVKKELPKKVEERLKEAAEVYINVLDELLTDLRNDFADDKEYNEMTELMLGVLLESLFGAVEAKGES